MAKVSKLYPFHLTPGGPWLTRRLLRMVTPSAPARTALLVGCRYGENAYAVAEMLECPVVGVEEDSEAILFAKMGAASVGKTAQISFRYMSPLKLDFPDGSFDVVVIEGVFAAYPRGKVLAEALRVLAPGGVLALAESCWLTEPVPTFVQYVWEAPNRKLLQIDPFIESIRECGVTDIAYEDASKFLSAFYEQFSTDVRTIVGGGYEGLKHHKSLVRHYKHEIDVYLHNGGSKYMGYVLIAGRKSQV